MYVNTKRGVAPLAAIIIAVLALGGGTLAVKKNSANKKVKVEQEAKANEERNKPTTLQVKLNEQNALGQGGQAVIVQVGTSTVRVIVNLVGKPSDDAQPAHIHLGSCPTPGAVKYPLTAVGKGASQTDIPNMTIEKLLSELPLAINVHKSATEGKVYVACGDIVAKEKTAVKEVQVKIEMKQEPKVTYTYTGFAPKSITIKKGETVVFENKTGKRASVASNDHPTHLIYPEFDQYKTIQRGNEAFKFTFTKVGTWNYHDHLNASAGGTVVVTE